MNDMKNAAQQKSLSQGVGKILRRQEMLHKVGLSYTTVWRQERMGLFPQRVRLSAGCVGWLEMEIDEWLASKKVVGGKHAG